MVTHILIWRYCQFQGGPRVVTYIFQYGGSAKFKGVPKWLSTFQFGGSAKYKKVPGWLPTFQFGGSAKFKGVPGWLPTYSNLAVVPNSRGSQGGYPHISICLQCQIQGGLRVVTHNQFGGSAKFEGVSVLVISDGSIGFQCSAMDFQGVLRRRDGTVDREL